MTCSSLAESMRSERTSGTSVRIAVIVLDYRTPEMVLDCLATVVPEVDPGRDAVIVVENASSGESATKIRAGIAERSWNRVRLVESPQNRGFAAGNNIGIGAVDAQTYLLLNSDTLIVPGTVERLWRTLHSDPGIGIVSPRLEWPDGTPQISCFRFHTPWSELIAGSATGPIRRLLERWDVPIPVGDEPFEPQWTSFAAVLIRRETLDQVGPLDEGFFMYYEDADYCRRARQAGWKVWHEPRAHVVHLRGGTSPVKALTASRKRRPRYYYTARSHYFRKAFGSGGLIAANSAWTMGRAIAWLRESFGQKRPHTVERELFDNWRG